MIPNYLVIPMILLAVLAGGGCDTLTHEEAKMAAERWEPSSARVS